MTPWAATPGPRTLIPSTVTPVVTSTSNVVVVVVLEMIRAVRTPTAAASIACVTTGGTANVPADQVNVTRPFESVTPVARSTRGASGK